LDIQLHGGDCEVNVSARNIVILLGGPGAGKGTQAELISAWLRIPHISTGQLLREEALAGSHLGLKAKATMDAGELVSSDIVNELVERRIDECDCALGFVLDGYPRDLGQAVKFNELLRTGDRLIVIDINADLERVLPRLTGRRICRSCNAIYHLLTSPPRHDGLCDVCDTTLMQRSDDREHVIRERFRIYQSLAAPLKCLYQRQGVYHEVDGLRPRDHVRRNIRRLHVRAIQPFALGVA